MRITVGTLRFTARLETERAPRSCAAFLALTPFRNELVQARWSGEAGWIPLGELEFGVPAENQLTDPEPGQILLYPGGYSETEILFPYGMTRFASKLGPLAGNHFLTITEGAEQFEALGKRLLREGAQEITFG
jgi:hypothetical protein